jgi:DNA recombination protein RmuC
MLGWTQFTIVAIVVALVVWAMAASLRRRGDAEAAALRQEMQSLLATQAQTVASHFGQLSQMVTQQLGQVTQSLQAGVADSGLLVAKAQEAVAAELKNSREMLGKVNQQLGEVQQAGRELSLASQALQSVLGGAKTRGTLGEIALERLLSDSLPQAAYETQYRFSSGEAVDAVVQFRDKLLPIDSKFPLDDYRKIGEQVPDARRSFAQAVKGHADALAKKYILPDENTLDIALMFVPSEGVYYELLMTEDAKGMALDAYCRSKNVIPVSPNTLHAHLSVIMMGLRGMQIEENARRLLAGLAGLKKQFDTFDDVYRKLGTHLNNAQQSYTEAERRIERARTALDQMAQGALPAEVPAKALEAAGKEGN